MDFLSQLFTSLGTRDSVLVIVFLFVAWLLGYLVKHLSLSARIAELEGDLIVSRSSRVDTQTEPLPFDATPSGVLAHDDLKRLEGIGPKIEELLNAAGIHTWQKLAQTTPEELAIILQNGGERFRIHDPSSWPQQARLLAEGRTEEFERLIDTLTAGRA